MPSRAADAERRQRIQHRRVGMDQRGLHLRGHLKQPRPQLLHQPPFTNAGQSCRGCGRRRGAEEVPTVDGVFGTRRRRVLGARHVVGVPPQAPLLAQDRQGPERVAAVQRDRVIQHMQHAQAHAATFSAAVGMVGGTVSHWCTSMHHAQEGFKHQQRPQRCAVVALAPTGGERRPGASGSLGLNQPVDKRRSPKTRRRLHALLHAAGLGTNVPSGTAKPILGR